MRREKRGGGGNQRTNESKMRRRESEREKEMYTNRQFTLPFTNDLHWINFERKLKYIRTFTQNR